jgi:predicted nucleotidyltransferase
MMEFLSGNDARVCERVLAEESALRRHVVVALSGAHAYGFPSPDSDLDLKSIHVAPTSRVLGLKRVKETSERFEVVDGVEIDYTSNEIRPVLAGIIAGNGNYIERVLGALICQSSPAHESLRPLVEASISRRVYRHYRGFAGSQRRAFVSAAEPTAKKLLYVLRTALTGTHLLRTGELRVDLSTVAQEYGFGHADELIETKRRGERVVLAESDRERWRADLDRLFAVLDQAHEESSLPDEAPNQAELDRWLVELRMSSM